VGWGQQSAPHLADPSTSPGPANFVAVLPQPPAATRLAHNTRCVAVGAFVERPMRLRWFFGLTSNAHALCQTYPNSPPSPVRLLSPPPPTPPPPDARRGFQRTAFQLFPRPMLSGAPPPFPPSAVCPHSADVPCLVRRLSCPALGCQAVRLLSMGRQPARRGVVPPGRGALSPTLAPCSSAGPCRPARRRAPSMPHRRGAGLALRAPRAFFASAVASAAWPGWLRGDTPRANLSPVNSFGSLVQGAAPPRPAVSVFLNP